MLVKAHSKKDAIKLAQKRFGYTADHIKVIPIKEPINIIWGLIKKRGKYQINIVVPSEKPSDKKDKQSYKNGHVEIKDGILTVVDPIDDGRYASITIDDPNIDVYINGKKEQGALIITEKDIIEFKPRNVDPSSKVSIEFLKDKMQAVLSVNKQKGRKFYVKDAKKNISIRICSKFEKIEPQNVTLAECVKALLDAGVKLEFMDMDAINELLRLPNGGSAVVAKGIAPIEGTKTQIKYYFSHRNQSINDFLYNSENDIETKPIVQIGDVLAAKLTPAIQGKDGLTVTGEPIKAKEIQDELLNAGEGAIILNNGMKVVASVSGRPVVENGAISVIPLLIISNDVNKDTGNIDFNGDVIIKGNIMDNMKVVAKGDIKVLGSVYNSEVISHENINILGKVIGGKIRAGVSIIDYFCIVPQMKIIGKVIRELLEDVRTNEKVNILVFQKMFRSERNVIEKSIKEIEKILHMMGNDDVEKICTLLKQIKDLLLVFNKLHIQDISQISKVYEELIEYVNSISSLYANDASIRLEYAQNSIIQACGHIVITGEGSYLSNLFAKDTITYNRSSSNVKGGILIAGKGIKAGTIGSNTGIRTYCKILDKGGKVNARYYDGTIINVNDRIKVIKTEHDTRFFTN